MRTRARSRVLYTARSADTETFSSNARQPTLISATPSLKAGRPRSTSAVGPTPVTRPRTTRAETKTFGACAATTGTSITGSLPLSATTRDSSTPSRSTVTSAVASRNGMRTCRRAVSPGS